MALPPVLDEENLYKFRTKICERYVKQGKCEFADKCQYSHDLRWTRRPPWKYTYSPELCRDLVFVTDGRGRTIAKSNCKQKRNCRFAHTKEEQMYHPKVYKTAMCHQFKENGWCDRYYCPFAHSEAELRHTEQTEETRKAFSKPAVQEALCPDIYLPSDRPHPRLRARFLAIMDGIPSQNHLHLSLKPSYLSSAGCARTRQPYTDFISSHTPHSVLSEGSPTAQPYVQQKDAAFSGNALEPSHVLDGLAAGNRAAKSSGQQLPAPTQQLNTNKDAFSDRRNQRTTSRLVQLLQAKQYAGNNAGDAASGQLGSSSLPTELHQNTVHADGPRMGVASALTAISDVPPYGSAYASTHSAASAHQWTSAPGSPSAANRMQTQRPSFTKVDGPPDSQHPAFDGGVVAALRPSFTHLGDRQPSTTYASSAVSLAPPFGSFPLPAGRLGAIVAKAEGFFGHPQKKMQVDLQQQGAQPSSSLWSNAERFPPEQGEMQEAKAAAPTPNDFRVKCLTSDICYWNEPIGRSRDDPSVLVYAGLILGPGKTREVVAVKQLPVVVLNRAGELWREVQRFLNISDSHLVNVKRALFLPGEADEGTSLWVVTEKCQGSIVDLFPTGTISPSFLQAAFPPTGLNGLLHYLLRAIQVLHQQSQGAHMRIHPGNIMIGSNGEVKLGDCAGKIRYLSILDLLHAGIQGASNAKALLQWILGTPQETCWMAPELLTSLLDLDEELSQAMWQCSNSADDGRNSKLFAEVARRFRWSADFLRKADAWSAGATLFYLASGGLHPYGSVNDPLTLANILSDKKMNFDKLNNCPWLAGLLAGLLCHKPAQRLSITQALHHPFFWTSDDIEIYLEDLRVALEQPRTEANARLQDALSYGIGWVDSLPYIPSPVPLLPLLLSYMAMPSASPQLLASHPLQNASSFLVFLAHVSNDQRIAPVERRLIVSESLMAHAAPFLHSVYLFLFPKLAQEGPARPTGFSANTAGGGFSQAPEGCMPGPLPPPYASRIFAAPPFRPASFPLYSRSSAGGEPLQQAQQQHQQGPLTNVFSEEPTGFAAEASRADVQAAVPPPPVSQAASGMRFGDSRAELPPSMQRNDFRQAFPHAGLGLLHARGGLVQEGLRKAATGGGPPQEVMQRSAILPSAPSGQRLQQQQQRCKDNAAVRQQQRPGGVAPGALTTERDAERQEGSPLPTARQAEEGGVKRTSKVEIQKQRGVGSKEGLRWASTTRQQAAGRAPPGMAKAAPAELWAAPAVESATSSAAPAEGLQLGAPSSADAEEVTRGLLGACSDASSASAASQGNLPAAEGLPHKPPRRLVGNAPPARACPEENPPAPRKCLTHTEVKLSLLQMPVAVSTVSTALSSATASDFCIGQSQPTDGAGEAGGWRQDQQQPLTSGPLPKEGSRPAQTHRAALHAEETQAAAAPGRTLEAAGGKQSAAAADAGSSQAGSNRENLRRDAANPCSIQ
ncbi:hypothetical protein Esti_003297 [Eimeria stiedai]